MVRVDEEADIPDSGAVFTFGKSKFADNIPSKFWIRNDAVSCLDCGDEHTLVLTVNGRAYVFGTNDWGQLGVGSTKSVSKPTCLKALKQEKTKCAAGGRSHSLLCTESGKVYAFGANGEGQLGLGDTNERIEPCPVDGIDGEVRMVAAGSYHSAILTVDGKLFTFGSNNEGQLGLGDVKGVTTPTLVQIDVPITSVSCGYYHTAFVADGKLYSFGEKEAGKLGLLEKQLQRGTTLPQCIFSITEKVASVSCGGNHTAVLTECGKMYVFGSGLNGQLGLGTMVMETGSPSLVGGLDGQKVVAVSCGESHTAIVTEQGKLMTCGDGRHGKLGLGNENFSNQFNPIVVKKFNDFFVHQVSCGGCHMVVLATKRQDGDPVVTSSGDEQKSLPMENSEHLETMLTARGRRREKELQGRPLLPIGRPLPPLQTTSEANQDVLMNSMMDDDLNQLRNDLTEIDAQDKDEETGETNNGNDDRNSVTSEISQLNKTHELVAVDRNTTIFTPVKQSSGLESSVSRKFQVEQMDNQNVDEKPKDVPESDSQEESSCEEANEPDGCNEDKNVTKEVDDECGRQSVEEGANKLVEESGNQAESQPKKESFLKKIFSFKKKNKSDSLKGKSSPADNDAVNSSENEKLEAEEVSNQRKEMQPEESKTFEGSERKDSIEEKQSKDTAKMKVEQREQKGSAKKKTETSQNATSKTCDIL